MTPDLWKSLSGGVLIGLGAAVLILLNGRIAGISGILSNAVRGMLGVQYWRVAFLIGLIAPAAVIGLGHVNFAAGLPLLAERGVRRWRSPWGAPYLLRSRPSFICAPTA